jgi:GT2 family glycosyltransferase
MENQINIKYRNVYKPVDIIIPFHEHYHILYECLDSIIGKTLGITYTITIVDDSSSNENFIPNLIKTKKLPIQYLRNTTQKGFGHSLKRGFDNTINDWVLFMHSDCRIEQTDWLINMQESMANNKNAGVKLVSAKTNNGGIGAYDENLIGTIDHKPDVIVENCLPLICCLVHRELFYRIDGFVKEYPYFGYEHDELFWRMKFHNYKQAVCGKSFVHHEGGTTVKELLKITKINKSYEENKSTFIKEIRKLYNK